MPGPAPKHPSLRARRNAKPDFRVLPADGRAGDAPAWPLQVDPSVQAQLEAARDRVAALQVDISEAEDGRTKGRLRRELNKLEITVAELGLRIEQTTDSEKGLWETLWATPQAVPWDDSEAFQREVATYVRFQIRAEQGDLKAAVEARLRSDRLGLNPLAMLRLRQEVENAEAAETRGQKRREATPRPSEPGEDPRGGLYIA